jgi:hypothetical protein
MFSSHRQSKYSVCVQYVCMWLSFLKDFHCQASVCMSKEIRFWFNRNAIRGLLKHLCEIPTDKIHLLEVRIFMYVCVKKNLVKSCMYVCMYVCVYICMYVCI